MLATRLHVPTPHWVLVRVVGCSKHFVVSRIQSLPYTPSERLDLFT